MTPLGVSLAFIMISILISVVKHFIFPSSAPATSEQSSIQIKKLYTITDKHPDKETKSYSSFYQAYHQFHLGQVQQRKQKIQSYFMQNYNSLAMKKSIINDELTIICEQNFIITVSEGIVCNRTKNIDIGSNQQCQWTTVFDVYELPFLKDQKKQSISIKGRLGLSKIYTKGENAISNLLCTKILDTKQYLVSFPSSKRDSSLNQEFWTLNKLTIKKFQDDLYQGLNEKVSLQQKQKIVKQKRLELQSNSSKSKKTSNKGFEIEIQQFNLKQPSHEPTTFSNNHQTLSYVTEQQPWLIRYKANNQWKQINILDHGIQNRVYQNLQYSSRIPPFQRNDKIYVKNLFVFDTKQNLYPIDCQDIEKYACKERVKEKKNTYLTVVYLHMNNQYRVEQFYVQLTFEIGKSPLSQKEAKQNSYESTSRDSQSLQSLVSYSLLVSEINPARQIHSDCSIHSKQQNIKERHYNKYYWLYEDQILSSLRVYSLLCAFRFQLDQHLKIVQIPDLIHSTELNRFNDFAFLDWKSLNKILNYKENFQKQTQLKNTQNSIHSKTHSYKVTINEDLETDHTEETHSGKTKRSQNPSDNLDQYIKIFNQQFVQSHSSKLKAQNQTQKDTSLQAKKKPKKKKNESEKKDKTNKKKKKNKSENQNKDNMALVKGQHKPSIETSFNYKHIKRTVFPHRSQAKKYKFPLPFLLSFTQKMEIVDADPKKPMILFSGVKQYLFTYNYESNVQNAQNSSLAAKVVDYRYLTLGSTYKPTSKFFHSAQGTPQYEIQTVKSILRQIQSKTSQKMNEKPNIDIKDETHPEVENVLKTMYQSDQQILNQVKSIKSIPVEINQNDELAEPYRRYLIVVWGWGVEVYLVDWDKNGFYRENVTQEQIEEELSRQSSNLIEYFLPFIELFATFYCMFQALISSR